MVNETGNRNRILEMYKSRIRFRLVHCVTITSVTRYGFRQILHADQKYYWLYVWSFGNHKLDVDIQWCADSDFRCFGLWSPYFSTDRHQIPFRVKIKQRRLCVLSGKWETGNTNRDVQIPISVSVASRLIEHVLCLFLKKSSVIADGRCDALCQLKSCRLLHNCTKIA